MTTTDRRCILCPRTDRDGAPRTPAWPVVGWPVCQSCYDRRLARPLEVIPTQWGLLSAAPGARTGQARVSGTGEPTLGVSVPVLDLMGPVNTGTVRDRYGDQAGHLSVATVLGGWVEDWAGQRGERLPVPTVVRLCEWLTDRLPWAAANHPALESFAGELARTAAALRTANGDTPAPDDHKEGVECARCDRMTLFDVGDFIECLTDRGGCGKLYKPSEYGQWVALKAHFIVASTPCPDCGNEALHGSKGLDRVDCVRAKGGCGYTMTWRVYSETATSYYRESQAA